VATYNQIVARVLSPLKVCQKVHKEEGFMDKKRVEQLLAEESNEIDVEAFAERLILLDKLARGERQLAAGQGVPHEQAKQKLGAWLK
jgi:hypothetical protein